MERDPTPDEIGRWVEWLARMHHVTVDAQILVDPLKTVWRVGELARSAAETLPFDSDPTEFYRLLEALAEKRDPHE